MQAPAPAPTDTGGAVEQRFGNAIAADGGFVFQGIVKGDLNIPSKSVL